MNDQYAIPGFQTFATRGPFVVGRVMNTGMFESEFDAVHFLEELYMAGYRIAMQGQDGLMILEPLK